MCSARRNSGRRHSAACAGTAVKATTSCCSPARRRRAAPFARPGSFDAPNSSRLHLDLYTDDQAGEVERLLALGATEVHWDKRPPDADYVILADPEGNRFCVVDTS